MTVVLRKKILQILYSRRDQPYSKLINRETLVHSMDIPWEDFQHEIDFLQEKGWINVKYDEIGSRIFETFQITAMGIEDVEGRLISEASSPHVDVLLVTVTEVEVVAVLHAFIEAKLCHFGDQAYHDLGMIKNARIFMVQSEMGSGGQSGAILTISEAIDVLHPSAIIMVGIAFGIDQKKQQPGDILISKQIQPYDLQKIGTSRHGETAITLRGDRPSASPKMLSIFRGAANYWQAPPNIHFGLILSGDKLIANQAFRDQLISLSPEAIGGEMEGAGLYAAAQRKKVDWLLVKAICDWADGDKNDAHQQLAAENTVRFLMHVLEKGGFAASKGQRFQADVVHDSFHVEVVNQTGPDRSRSPENAKNTTEASPVNLQHKIEIEDFDVFLSYNTEDRREVKKIAENLKEQGILPWFDEWELRPGLPWQRALEMQIKKIKSAAIFVGKAGLGPWQRLEMEAILRQFVKQNCPTIPVLLVDAPLQPDLPIFLEGMAWVDFRQNDPDPLKRLIWGITGIYSPEPEVLSPDRSKGDVADLSLFSSTAARQNALDKSSVNTIHIPPQDPTISVKPITQHGRPLQPYRITRRTLLLLSSAGVGMITIGGIGWFELTQHSSRKSVDSVKTPTRPSSQPEPIATETLPGAQNSEQRDINTIAWSPNGQFIASGSNDSTVLVRNVITDKIIFKKPQPSHVQSVAWSPDSTKIAVGNQDGSLHILNVTNDRWIASVGGPPAFQRMSISWSQDGKQIVATGAQIWDATTGKLLFTYPDAETDCSVAWSPDGTRIALGSHSNSASGSYAGVDIWNATTHKTICQYINRSQIISPTNAIAWSPNGIFIAVSYTSGTVVDVWDTTTTTSEPIMHTSQRTSKNVLAWSPDSTKIASLALDGIEIWDTITGKTIIPIIQGSSNAICVTWSPDGSEIAFGSDMSGTVQIAQTSLPLASTLIYQTHWSDGDGGWNHTNGWMLQRGMWINSGKGSEGHLTLPGSLYSRKTNYSIATTIQFNQFVPSSDGSEFGIMTDIGYTWVIRSSSNGGTESVLLDGNGGETKARTHYVSDLSLITPGTTHSYQVEVKQGIFMCLIDGRLYTDYLLPTNLQQEPIMGLMTKHSDIIVSNFQIFSL